MPKHNLPTRFSGGTPAGCGHSKINLEPTLAKGCCRAKFWAKFPFWRGGSSVRSFSRSLPRSFSRSFRPCFAGTFRAKKTSAKTSALNSHDPAQQNWRNFREKLHDEVLQGDPHQNQQSVGQSPHTQTHMCRFGMMIPSRSAE